jgi:hypothetical protein
MTVIKAVARRRRGKMRLQTFLRNKIDIFKSLSLHASSLALILPFFSYAHKNWLNLMKSRKHSSSREHGTK